MSSLIKKALDRVMEAEEQGPITEPVEQGTWTVAVPAFGPGPAGVVSRWVVSAGTPEEALQAADPEFREADPENLVFDRMEGSDVWWVSSREVADFMVVIASGDVPEEEMVKRAAMARAEREAGPEEDSELQIYGQEPSGAMGEQEPEPEEKAKELFSHAVSLGIDDSVQAILGEAGLGIEGWEKYAERNRGMTREQRVARLRGLAVDLDVDDSVYPLLGEIDGTDVKEQEGPYSVEKLKYLQQELGAVIRERVFQMIEDRVGRGKIKDISLLDPVTDAIDAAVRSISPKVAAVLKNLGGYYGGQSQLPTEELEGEDPYVPLETVESFCGPYARELMARNMTHVKLSVLERAVEEKKLDVSRFTRWCRSLGLKGGSEKKE